MTEAYDVPDSTDWLETPLKDVAGLENSLHCQICKEFYDTPMITTCNHTFCSKCIRTSLSVDGKCPVCRALDQANKLRNNWAIQEVVSAFAAARSATLELARKAQKEADASKRPGKRKRNIVLESEDNVETDGAGRTTRSKSRRIAASQDSQTETIEIGDSEEDEELSTPESPPEDGLVECPLGCGKRMKEEQVFGHLDKCEDEQKQAKRTKSWAPLNNFASSKPSSSQSVRPQERINELNYSMMKENALAKKLKEIGISGFGSKQLMINRHKEWVNIWNANCDSNQPRSRRELIRDLDVWERTQGGKAPNANGISSTIMRKDFDGDAHSRRHQDEFSRLIADAKRKKNLPQSASPSSKDVEILHLSPEKSNTNEEVGKSPFFVSTVFAGTTSSNKDQSLTLEPESSGDSKSFEYNTGPISSIRANVEKVNHSEETGPIWNKGFETPGTNEAEDVSNTRGLSEKRSPLSDEMIVEANDATSSISHHSIQHSPTMSSSPRVGSDRRAKSRDEHIVHDTTGWPCDIASHLDLESPGRTKKVPMFEVPSQQVGDIDGAATND